MINIKKYLNYRTIRSHLIITFGLLLTAVAWTAFLIPAKITGGGITGVSTLIFYASGFPLGVSYLIINSILILFAIKILGRDFGVKTVFSVIVMSALFSVLQQYITKPIVNDTFLSTVIGGILGGAGIGIVFSQGGSTGGTDIIAMIINKYRNISPGRIILYIDVFIIASSYLIFQSLEKIVYGYVAMGITSYTIDLLFTGSKQSVQIFIFSKKYNEIAERIGKEVQRGVTIIDGKGWYTGEQTKILLVMVKKPEASQIFRIIKEMDKDAFMSVNNVMGVYGKGFETIRM
ncbi:MAG: YitT family protein [Bacteroidales bacterium]